MRRPAFLSVLLPSVLLLAGLQTAPAQPGSSGMPLLKLSVAGRSVAMGYTSTLETGPAGIQANPANIRPTASGNGNRLLFTHQEWVQDARTEYLGATATLGEQHSIGFSLLTTTVSDIEIRTRPGPAEGVFTARDLAVGLSFAGDLTAALQAGLTARFLYQKLLVNEATGYSIDAGVRMGLPVEGLEAGVALLNLGRMSVLREQRTKLPLTARAGLAYRDSLSEDLTVTGSGDLIRVIPEKRFYAGLGAEVWFREFVALRVGNEFGSEGRGFTTGLGVAYGLFSLDYAYARLRQNLGTTHTFTLGLTL